MIKIWHPRYFDRTVLIAKYKVKDGTNKIIFTKAKTLMGKTFTMDGQRIREYPLETNGKIPCYAVSMEELI